MDVLEITHLEGATGLRLAGELDLSTVGQLEEALAGVNRNGKLKLDLSELTFIDSTGLNALVECARARNGSGPVLLEGLSPMIMRVFEITNLAQHPSFEFAADGR